MADVIWKDVPGFEGLYEVSSSGEVRRLPREILNRGSGHRYVLPAATMKPQYDKDGYLVLNLMPLQGAKPVNVKVHRLVALAFLPNPEDLPEVDHIDRDRTNPCVTNLRWASVPLNRQLPEYEGKGVRYRESRPRAWQAYTSLDGRFKSIGTFFTKEEAVAARQVFIEKGKQNVEACAS